MRRVSSSRARRPRGVYVATGVGAALAAIIALALYLPLVGFLAATTASTAGLVPFPLGSVTGVTLLGLLVVAGALLLAVTRRRPWMSWTLAIIAVIVALAVTVFPLIAVAVGSADRASDIVPIVVDLWQRVTGG
ncbi:MFS transporter permease [uncultured Microbacterium sp.]|uniref:MFS transporter permease n=1 Tax=uncultured Microbacterium sp. TaxID=191216 RepID=UPI0028D13F9C|nr:MFS transporter permease [uncultured Microbacterium sp.]